MQDSVVNKMRNTTLHSKFGEILFVKHRISPKTWDLLVCGVLVVLATVLRCLYIGVTDIGNDECFSLYYSQFSVDEIIKVLCKGDNPPLWEILLHGWIKVFGFGLLSMRILSLLFSVCTVVPLYLLGKSLSGRGTGIVAALLYTLSTFSIFLSHDGRVYSLVGMLAAWSAYLFLRLIEQPGKGKWILWVVVNLLIMYCHYLALWVIVMQVALWLLIPSIRKRLGKYMLIALASLALLYIPIVPTLIRRFLDSGLHGTWVSRCEGFDDLYGILCCFTNAPVTTVLAIALMVAAMIKCVVRIFRRKFEASMLMWITLMWVVPMLISFGLSFLVGFFLNRYFYFLLPIYLLSLAGYIKYLFPNQGITSAVMSVLLVVAMALSVKPDSSQLRNAGWKGNVSAVVERMKELKETDTLTIIVPDWIDKQLVFYLDDNHEGFRTKGTLDEPAFMAYLIDDGYRYESNYQEFNFSECSSVIIVHDNSRDISAIVDYLSTNGFQQSQQEPFQQMTLTVFAKQHDC